MSQPHCSATMNTEMIDIFAETYVSNNQIWRKQVLSSHGRGKNNGLSLQDIALKHYLCFSSKAWFFCTQFFINQVLCPTFCCFWELNYDDLVHFLRLDSNQNISNKGEYVILILRIWELVNLYQLDQFSILQPTRYPYALIEMY